MRLMLDTCVIIAHAITERMALLSSDEKFLRSSRCSGASRNPFYRNQGLELIEY